MGNIVNQSREYKIYDRESHRFFVVPKEVYCELKRHIWAAQKQAQRHGHCRCPQNRLWQCDGCCVGCAYRNHDGEWSLDQELEIKGDTRADSAADFEDGVLDGIYYGQVLKRLEELCPGASRIGCLRLAGFSEREIAEMVGIPCSTFRSRLKKARVQLLDEFGDVA